MARMTPDSRLRKTIKVDGKVFTLDGTRYSHLEALREARRLRKTHGWRVRVVQLAYKSAIYVRKGT